LLATHSTRPTSLDSATAADAAGDVGLVERYGAVAAGIGWTRGVLDQAGVLDVLVGLPAELRLRLPGGVLRFERARGSGLAAVKLTQAPVTLRSRCGGERIRLAANRPSRAVKKLLQEAHMPPWERDALPGTHDALVSACRRAGFEPRLIDVPDVPGVLGKMLADGVGVSVISEFVAKASTDPGVVWRPLIRPRVILNGLMIWSRSAPTPAARALVASLGQLMSR